MSVTPEVLSAKVHGSPHEPRTPEIVDSADVCFIPGTECTFCLLFFVCAELCDLAGSSASARKIYIEKCPKNQESIKNRKVTT